MPSLSPGPEARKMAPVDLNAGSNAAHSSPIKMPGAAEDNRAETLDEARPPAGAGNGLRRPSTSQPAMPVMPDFDDIVSHRRRGSQSANVEPEPVGIKRKTSIVKKLTGRVG